MNCKLNVSVINSLICLTHICISAGISHGRSVDRRPRNNSSGNQIIISQDGLKPCCLPYRFQAVIVNLPSFSADKKEVTRLYRDWENKLQIQESAVFNSQGIERIIKKFFMDYKNMVEYIFVPGGPCQQHALDFGMLEPCMPDNSTYLGKSYIGAYSDQTNFHAWNFRRTDLNRDIEMTITVTSDRCVPVSEHITGRLGAGQVDGLFMFTNMSETVDGSAFNFPLECIGVQPM